MPLKIVHSNHVDIVGEGLVILTASYANSPSEDLHVGQIVEEVALLSKCYAVIGKVSREFLDSNRIEAARSEMRKSIQAFLEGRLGCILHIQGKKGSGIDIGITPGRSGSELLAELVRARLATDFNVSTSKEQISSDLVKATPLDEMNSGGNSRVELVQIAIGDEERTRRRDRLVEDVADIVGQINRKLGFSEGDERSGGTLD